MVISVKALAFFPCRSEFRLEVKTEEAVKFVLLECIDLGGLALPTTVVVAFLQFEFIDLAEQFAFKNLVGSQTNTPDR